MKISCVTNLELKFGIHIIAHKIYLSSHPNSVSCEAVDSAYKVVKNNLSFDLVELLVNQLNKNMESIQSSKNNPCNLVYHLLGDLNGLIKPYLALMDLAEDKPNPLHKKPSWHVGNVN